MIRGWGQGTRLEICSVVSSVCGVFPCVGVCCVLVHLVIKYKLKFLPESIAFVFIGELDQLVN